MGFLGNLVFYTSTRPCDAALWTQGVCEVAGATSILLASRWRCDEWRRFRRIARNPAKYQRRQRLNSKDDTLEFIQNPDSLEQVIPMLRHRRQNVRLMFSKCPMSQLITDATATIPESIRDYFTPGSMGIVVGPHDIYESFEHEKGYRYGRAQFSVSFSCPGAPHDMKKYRDHVFELPEIISCRRAIETIIGPMEQCVYWEG